MPKVLKCRDFIDEFWFSCCLEVSGVRLFSPVGPYPVPCMEALCSQTLRGTDLEIKVCNCFIKRVCSCLKMF